MISKVGSTLPTLGITLITDCHLLEAALRISLCLSISHLTRSLWLAPRGHPVKSVELAQTSIASSPNYHHSDLITQRRIIIPLTKVRNNIWNAACLCKSSPHRLDSVVLGGFFPAEPEASRDTEESALAGMW